MAGNNKNRLIPFLDLGPNQTGWGCHVTKNGQVIDTVVVRCAPGTTIAAAEAEQEDFFDLVRTERQLARRKV